MSMHSFHIHTPLLLSRAMSDILGTFVYLKMEASQPIGSYKIRGIGCACGRAFDKGYKHLIAASGGNAGYAVAYAGRQLGVDVTVIVPKTTSVLMQGLIAEEGAKIKIYGDSLDEASEYALKMATAMNAAYIHPFDHPDLWDGHGTMVDEIIEDGIIPGTVVLAVGGGGLLCGVAKSLQSHGLKSVPIIAMEPVGASSLYQSVLQQKVVALDKTETIALSLAAKRVAEEAFQWTKRHPISVKLVTDQMALRACLLFADQQRVLVEPACGVALAAVYEKLLAVDVKAPVVVVVCGGANVSLQLFEEWRTKIEGKERGNV